MTIYTRQGDSGWTKLATGQSVLKDSAQIAANGCLDLASAQIAKARGLINDQEITAILTTILHKLALCSAIAAGLPENSGLNITQQDITLLEHNIDNYTAKMEPLNAIIIPNGTAQALELNLSRAMVRQAELHLWRAQSSGASMPMPLMAFLNRLSDLLFVLSNYENHKAGIKPELWKK